MGTLWHRTNWLRGFENSLVDVVEDRPEMYALRDRITDFLLKRVEILLRHREHIDGILVNDDWGTQETLMIRPEYWRKVYKPAYAKIVAAIKSGGCFAHLHSDGVTDAIMEDLIEIGFDELNPQMSCMDIESVGRRFGGRVCFRADMDRQYVLPFGTPADVTALVERLYDRVRLQDGAATSATARSTPTCPSRMPRPCWWRLRESGSRREARRPRIRRARPPNRIPRLPNGCFQTRLPRPESAKRPSSVRTPAASAGKHEKPVGVQA